MEDDGTRILFVAVRRLNRIARDMGLLAKVAERLWAEGRARMTRDLGVSHDLLPGETARWRPRSRSPFLRCDPRAF